MSADNAGKTDAVSEQKLERIKLRALDVRAAVIQASSGLAFGGFLTLHLLNQAAFHLGWDFGNQVHGVVRSMYQCSPVVELSCVMGSLAVHMCSNIMRNQIKTKLEAFGPTSKATSQQSSTTLKWHQWTGYTVAMFVGAHTIATRVLPLWFSSGLLQAGVPLDYSYITVTLKHVPWLFLPYYIVFSGSAAYHGIVGAFLALSKLLAHFPSKNFAFESMRRVLRTLRPIMNPLALAGVVITTSSVLALAGFYYDIPIIREKEYLAFLSHHIPFGLFGSGH
eukprot:Colp12_sorted_trinity150504_noHs@4683